MAARDCWRLFLLWLAGIDLRLTILALPPVLPLIHRDLELSEKAVAVLTGLPVLLFAIVAIPGALLISRLGARRTLVASLVAVAVSSACRGFGPSIPMLFGMTLVMGAGIAIMQPAMPSLVNDWFRDRAGLATAVYANGLLIGEALAAAFTLPVLLPLVGGSWPLSFVIWAVPVLVTAALVAEAARPQTARPTRAGRLWWPDLRDRNTWALGLLSAASATIYFGANAFLPDFLYAAGTPELVGPCLTSLNVGQLPSSILLLLFAKRLSGRKAPLVAAGIGSLLGLALFAAGGAAAEIAGAGLIGLTAAFALILTLALPVIVGDPNTVHRLAAGMFAIGHSIAFAVSLIGGVIWDATGSSVAASLPVLAGVVFLVAGVAVLRPPQGH
ncbi:MAG TPA: MFS transporter [Stellaceae bacterium]|nr:MFS transporter [Stellaceae bacterium]